MSRSKLIDEKTKKSKTLKEMNDEINEKNHKKRKTIDTNIKCYGTTSSGALGRPFWWWKA